MNLTHSEAQIIRAKDNAVGLMNLAQSRGWTDAETAEAYNSQTGAGGTWTADSVAKHRAWLVSAGMWAPFVVQTGDYAMIGGKRFNLVPA